ncbi:MAG: YlxM family DNA-binding protein [Negativicutes bacterium]|nr:YlxM family DNA-binding protein [Negativicutes bacterium]
MLAKVLRIGQLYDFYGSLLTDKQRRCLELHYLNDLSLAEIAAEFQVSRQAVHDILRRGEQILEDYETKLGLVERYRQDQETIHKAYEMLNSLPHDFHRLRKYGLALDMLKQLLNREEEV